MKQSGYVNDLKYSFIGCFTIKLFSTLTLDGSIVADILEETNIDKWDIVNSKVFVYHNVDFSPNSEDIKNLEKLFNAVFGKCGNGTVSGSIIRIDREDSEGSRLLKATRERIVDDLKIELFEIGIVKEGAYADWTLVENKEINDENV